MIEAYVASVGTILLIVGVIALLVIKFGESSSSSIMTPEDEAADRVLRWVAAGCLVFGSVGFLVLMAHP